MLKNVIIVVLVLCCGYLLLRLYAPQELPNWFGGGSETAEKAKESAPPQSQEPPKALTPSASEKSAPGSPEVVLKPATTAEEVRFGSRVLEKGTRGPDVLHLQERLKLAGFVREYFTPGVFDDATEQAVLDYQKGTDFLAEMYHFRGLPSPPKPYVDAELARQLLRVPTPNKVLVHYTVAPGENLFRIATRFGIGVESIKYLNNMVDSNALRAGQSLLIICDRSKGM